MVRTSEAPGVENPPHPARLRLAALSREGRGLVRAEVSPEIFNKHRLPSPLAGEGSRRRRVGEGAFTPMAYD